MQDSMSEGKTHIKLYIKKVTKIKNGIRNTFEGKTISLLVITNNNRLFKV